MFINLAVVFSGKGGKLFIDMHITNRKVWIVYAM